MALAKVVIVGRPNVGKSSIFNWLLGRRVAIVDPTSGVTRDRVTALAEWNDRFFEVIDTGGMGVEDVDGLTEDVEKQIAVGLEEADLILFVLDAQTGVTGLDQKVVRKVRACNLPTICVANKSDNDRFANQASEFHKYGWPTVFVSVTANRNRENLFEAILEELPTDKFDTDPAVEMKIAAVGRRNAGKSTFINTLAETERMIVSSIPGTTRDSVDVRFEHNGKSFIAIDTAGVKRAKGLSDNIEFYSQVRAQQTIRRADVVLLFIDPTEKVGKLDKELASYVVEHHKPCVFVVNKWDLMLPLTTGEFNEYLEACFPSLTFAPRAFITAKTGQNVHALIDLSQSLFRQANARVSTSEINRALRDALARQSPPMRQNRTPKIYYGSQVSAAPPTIILFCNGPDLFDPAYERYLLREFRERLPFSETPIKLHFRRRDSHSTPRHPGAEEAPDEFEDFEFEE